MPDLLAGTIIKALDTPPTQADSAANSYDTNGTGFTTGNVTVGSYEDVAVVFTAPTTGRVEIITNARLINTSTSGTLVAPETRAGGVIGSGTPIELATDGIGVSHYGTTFARASVTHLLTGLTPGNVYNTRLLHRVSANSGSIALRELIVKPAT